MIEYPDIIFEKQITMNKRPMLTPKNGDKLFFCKTEEDAFSCFNELSETLKEMRVLLDEKYNQVYLTDFFMLGKVEGTLHEPVFINEKRYGFFGWRNDEIGRF